MLKTTQLYPTVSVKQKEKEAEKKKKHKKKKNLQFLAGHLEFHLNFSLIKIKHDQ